MEIALKPEDQELLEKHVASGRYRTPEDVIEAALELLHERDRLVNEIDLPTEVEERALLKKSLEQYERGEYGTLRTDDDVEELIDRVRQGVQSKRAHAESARK